MTTPPSLKKNALIAIVAPAGKIDPILIEQAEYHLEKKGFRVTIGKHTKGSYFKYSGTDAQRLHDFQEMINRPDVDAILCARGGYGSIRIIDQLDFSSFINNPKWLIGFSDITVFHACLQNKLNIASIHGPMTKDFNSQSPNLQAVDTLLDILEGQDPEYVINPHPLNHNGKAKGKLIGGNLSILQAMRGTPYDIKPEGSILFIEDLAEYLYHLDRMMLNLKIGGILSKISGLVVGQFSEMQDNDDPFGQDSYNIIKEAVAEYNYPVMFNFPSGHTDINFPLIFGKEVEIEVTSEFAQLKY